MTKGERLDKDILWGEIVLGEIDKIGHGQRGSNIEEYKGIKILGQEKAHK
jgi:hypothetical protein